MDHSSTGHTWHGRCPCYRVLRRLGRRSCRVGRLLSWFRRCCRNRCRLLDRGRHWLGRLQLQPIFQNVNVWLLLAAFARGVAVFGKQVQSRAHLKDATKCVCLRPPHDIADVRRPIHLQNKTRQSVHTRVTKCICARARACARVHACACCACACACTRAHVRVHAHLPPSNAWLSTSRSCSTVPAAAAAAGSWHVDGASIAAARGSSPARGSAAASPPVFAACLTAALAKPFR